LFAWSSVVETFIYEWGDFHPLDRWIAELDTILAENPESLTPELEGRVALWMFLALTYRQPGNSQLRRWTLVVEQLVESCPDPSLRFVAGLHLLLYYAFWGAEFAKGASLIDMLTPIARATDLSPLPRVAWHATQAAYHWMVGENEACLREAERGLEVSAETGVHLWDFMLRAQGVWGWLTAENLDRAAAERETLHAQLDPLRYMDATHYHYQVAMAAWYQGEIPRMKKHAEAALRAVRKAGLPWAECLVLSGLATAHVESGDLVAAEEVCGESRRLCEVMHIVIAEFCLLFAEYEIERGRPGPHHSTAALRRLLEYGRRIDLVGGAMWNAQPLARICLQGLRYDIEPDYVRRIIKLRGLTPPADAPVPDTWPCPLKLHTLGRFTVTRDDQPLSRSPSHQKPLELLQALIALGGREVDEERLAELFWPEAEGDVAIQNLKINVHRLRKLLPEDALVWTEGKLTLDAHRVWVDLWALERELNRLDQATPAKAVALAQRIFRLYRGAFLPENTAPWALAARERIHNKTLRLVTRAAETLLSTDPVAAVPLYDQAIELDPLRESLYQGLMRCHRALHRPAEVEHVYRRCRDVLKRELGVEPSGETETLIKSLRAK
jgi:DNA-binding SARP family transcriptional activator